MQPHRARTSDLGVPPLLLARWVGWAAAVGPTNGVWFVVARPSVDLGAHICAVSWATWLLFTGVPARCIVLRVRCPGPLGSCSPVYPFSALSCVCGVMGHFAPIHRCACSVRCVACAVPWATCFLFTGMPARCAVLRVRCPGPLDSCSPVWALAALCCVCAVLGHLAPVHRCARPVRCVVCAESWATWLLFTCVPARCVVLRCVCGVLGHLAPVHRCACPLCCVTCAVYWATWLLFAGVLARCGVLLVRCLGHLANVHWCARRGPCVACAVSWATWLLFTGVLARRVVFCVWCPGRLGSCSPVCPLGVLCCLVVSRVRCPGPLDSCSLVYPLGVFCCVCVVLNHLAPLLRLCWLGAWCCVCGVQGHFAPVHRGAHLV